MINNPVSINCSKCGSHGYDLILVSLRRAGSDIWMCSSCLPKEVMRAKLKKTTAFLSGRKKHSGRSEDNIYDCYICGSSEDNIILVPLMYKDRIIHTCISCMPKVLKRTQQELDPFESRDSDPIGDNGKSI